VAHACARAALSLDVYVVSYDTIPGFLAEVVQPDFMSSMNKCQWANSQKKIAKNLVSVLPMELY
jgi:hypothetical protein